jgi:NADH-quinone oxidoreductase subunit C
MSKEVIDRLKAQLGDRILETSDFRGDHEALVAPEDWKAAAELLRNDAETAMDMFTDITAVDHPERQPELPRFDVVLIVRSLEKNHSVRIRTRVGEQEELDSLTDVWAGANWGEREVFDMFGVRFKGHPDLKRVLLYDEFEGHPLRKDYYIKQTQPRLPYRDVEGIEKIPPFGEEEGSPFNRIDWMQRLKGGNLQVSPSLARQQGQAPAPAGPAQPDSKTGEE